MPKNFFTSVFNALSDFKTRRSVQKQAKLDLVGRKYFNSLKNKGSFDAVILAIDEEDPSYSVTSNSQDPMVRVAKVRPLDIQDKTLPNPCDYNEPEQIRYVTSMHPTAYSEGITRSLKANSISPGDIVECYYSIQGPENDGQQRGLRFKYIKKGRASGNYPARCLQILGATLKGGKVVVQEAFNTGGSGAPVGNIGRVDESSDTTPGVDNWYEEVLYKAIADEGRSKDYTDVKPLNGGIIGIAHWTGRTLTHVYDMIQDTPGGTVLYLGKSREALKSFESECKDLNCYEFDWWKSGMDKWVQTPKAKELQISKWAEKYGKPTDKFIASKSNWYPTMRARAIAAGIRNSAGGGGLNKYSDNGKLGPEQTLANYAADHIPNRTYGTEGEHSAHYGRRRDRINKYFPKKS